MKLRLEYPRPCYSNRDPEAFKEIVIIGISFDTRFFYVKNHDTGFEEFVLTILGFGLRLSREEQNNA